MSCHIFLSSAGLVFSDGPVWKEHRRFALRSLRDFGMGKISLQAKIHDELAFFLDEIATQNGKAWDLQSLLPKAISNNICAIIYGSRFEYDDPIFQRNIDAISSSVRHQSLVMMMAFIPFLEILPKLLPKFKMLRSNVDLRERYAQQQIDEHLVNYDPDNPRDFIDVYLAEMHRRKERDGGTSFDGEARCLMRFFTFKITALHFQQRLECH